MKYHELLQTGAVAINDVLSSSALTIKLNPTAIIKLAHNAITKNIKYSYLTEAYSQN